jgi:hypothetical protein
MFLFGAKVIMKDLLDVIVYIEDCQCPYSAFESRTVAEDLNRVDAFNDFDYLEHLLLGVTNETLEGYSIA